MLYLAHVAESFVYKLSEFGYRFRYLRGDKKMYFKIDRTAFKYLLNVLLSCRCPVSEDTEAKLVNYFKSTAGKDVVDYEPVISIANEEGETVFHRLREFCTYSIDHFSFDPIISVNDVLRHFCTAYHWHVVEEALAKSYRSINNIPSWFISHMLLPVKLNTHQGEIIGTFIDSLGSLTLRNLFLPLDLQTKEGSLFCVHFASVIGEISSSQFELVGNHLAEILDFQKLRNQVSDINFHNFQRFGDYKSFCRERYEKYF